MFYLGKGLRDTGVRYKMEPISTSSSLSSSAKQENEREVVDGKILVDDHLHVAETMAQTLSLNDDDKIEIFKKVNANFKNLKQEQIGPTKIEDMIDKKNQLIDQNNNNVTKISSHAGARDTLFLILNITPQSRNTQITLTAQEKTNIENFALWFDPRWNYIMTMKIDSTASGAGAGGARAGAGVGGTRSGAGAVDLDEAFMRLLCLTGAPTRVTVDAAELRKKLFLA
jgi:hypothetical protein